MNRIRLASRKRPIIRKQVPAANALTIMVATMVMNSALPCRAIVEPIATSTTMAGDGSAEIAPR